MQTMLVMNINPELEEDMVDYLLGQEFINGFTSYQVNGHGAFSNMSLAEQVSGRRKRVQLEVLLEQAAINTILEGLKSNVGVDIVYWEQAITNHGKID
jgi:hypothetical protein